MFFTRRLEYLIKKLPVPTKRKTNILIGVKSCNALLPLLLVSIRNYLKSVLRFKYLISDISHPNTLFFLEKGSVDPR